eukprot:GHVS01050345.1.p1 GENE.GHVS01050345.1~~GHVS01050345.1.p1  ORF type:complete len:105 (+),score=0.52 GHVS01050345.1:238-552(+)
MWWEWGIFLFSTERCEALPNFEMWYSVLDVLCSGSGGFCSFLHIGTKRCQAFKCGIVCCMCVVFKGSGCLFCCVTYSIGLFFRFLHMAAKRCQNCKCGMVDDVV